MEPSRDPPAAVPIRDATSKDRFINRVVVAMADGKRHAGFVYDLNINEATFHLFATEDPADSNSQVLVLEECKAIYFVRSHTGNPHYRENKTELGAEKRFGRPYRITFADGEILVGTVEFYHGDRKGFYLIPPDPKSNNLRIFVIVRHTLEIISLAPEGKGPGHGEWTAPDPLKYPPVKRIEVATRLLRGKDLRALSVEVFLAPRVMHYWKESFVQGGGTALTNEALVAARVAEDAARAGEKLDRYRPEERLDMVLRLFQNEDQAVVSQVFLVPFKTLAEWRERFLDAAKEALHVQFEEEGQRPSEEVFDLYERLPEPDAPPKVEGMDDFLEGLSKSVGG